MQDLIGPASVTPRYFDSEGSTVAESRDSQWRLSPRWLIALLLLCAIPRIILATRLHSTCDDSFYYMYVAQHLEAGNEMPLLRYLNLNVFPIILLAGHQTGLPWHVAGQVWSVFAAILLILPLLGWTRRLFNDRIAFLSCFLYTIQPTLIEISVEPVRETTFWLFSNAFLYFLTRAITDLRWRWFALTGLMLGLAIQTRTEGWALLVPCGVWLVWAWRRNPSRRWRLSCGHVVVLAVMPTVLIALNLTLLRHHEEWQWGRLSHFAVGWNWMKTSVFGEPPQQTKRKSKKDKARKKPARSVASKTRVQRKAKRKKTSPVASAPATIVRQESWAMQHQAERDSAVVQAKASLLTRVRFYAESVIDSFEIFNLAMLAVGLSLVRGAPRKLLLAGLIAAGVLLCVAIWVLLSVYGHVTGRYFLSAFILLLPIEAAGLWCVLRWLSHSLLSRLEPNRAMRYVAIVFLGGSALIGCADGATSSHKGRRDEVAFAKWAQRWNVPPERVLVDHASRRVGYHIYGELPNVMARNKKLEWCLKHVQLDLLLLTETHAKINSYAPVVANPETYGFRRVDLTGAPTIRRAPLIILMRDHKLPQPKQSTAALERRFRL